MARKLAAEPSLSPRSSGWKNSPSVLGEASRWRRRGKAHLYPYQSPGAGLSHSGPGSMAWEVNLNPMVAVMLVLMGAVMEINYAPIFEGVRSHDPIVTDGRKGKTDLRSILSRYQRTGGIPVTQLLADPETFEQLDKHLRQWHSKINGTIRGTDLWYDANSNREMLATHVTGAHAGLLIYEHTVFRNGRLPHRLSDAERDRYWSEMAEFYRESYSRTDIHPEDVPQAFPTTAAEAAEFYERHSHLFFIPEKLFSSMFVAVLPSVIPMTKKLVTQGHWRALPPLVLVQTLTPAGLGMAPRKVRAMLGFPRITEPLFALVVKTALPLYWLLQRPFLEEALVRTYFGPDCWEMYRKGRDMHRATAGAAADHAA